ncbi:MAG: AmmeMemoRadiSam system protein A [Firmicutes bacterium]|nr:AmmeMemoRadiSam system protein A [Bacillota bacterium]
MSILAGFMVPHPPMIVPEIGRGSEAQIEETIRAYEQVGREIAALKPETIVITSPHSVMYADYFHVSPGTGAKGSFSDFGAPRVAFRETYDEKLRDEICRLAAETGLRAGTLGERSARLDHGTMVPLYFIRKYYNDFKLVRIGLSGLPLTDHYALGMLIREAAEKTGRKTVLVGSGDLSHKLQDYGPYGFAEEGPVYDERIMDVMGRAAFGELFNFSEDFCARAAECGHRSFVILAGTLDGMRVKAERLSHQDVTGVGYGICTFYPQGPDPERLFLDRYLTELEEETTRKRAAEDAYVQLARRSLESYIRNGKTLKVPGDLPEGADPALLATRAGAFVSIHEHGQLRGCIGTIAPTKANLAEEIIENAISAATRDPRFDAIRESELPFLEISVDVLGEPEEISSPAQLDVKNYGVIVSKGRRRGLLLPDLEGVDTVEDQIAIAKRKAGIGLEEEVRLERFRVVRHH